ncbi:hypothetical protein Ddye_014168 [Dipteronia dyeriana]|uniref:Uncharacterized protein n=1 Tax=Dipteronia dyeriana TaxID=168575 RepID=A0AAE0CKB6_9ROSI|nr:hypothetical protein Ddye_014168 [Dipteronia dyeriana]
MRPLLPSIPLCYLNNSETILVTLWTRLMFWDSEDEEFKEVEIGCIQDGWSVENVFVESLVSPNRINGFTNEAAYDMLNTSGFGRNDTHKCVTVSPEILEEYLKFQCPNIYLFILIETSQ